MPPKEVVQEETVATEIRARTATAKINCNIMTAIVDTSSAAFETDKWRGIPRAKARKILYALMLFQGVGATFFLGVLWSEVLGFRNSALPYEIYELIQICASLALLAGMISTLLVLSSSFNTVTKLSQQMDVVAGQYQSHLETQFREWGLSASERAVAIYAMKGFSNTEVANLRGTSVATVKTQLNAVYKKSGCDNRQQLTSFLIEDLLSGVVVG